MCLKMKDEKYENVSKIDAPRHQLPCCFEKITLDMGDETPSLFLMASFYHV